MALVSGRATITSLEVLSLLIASYLYAICQALDLRALQHELYEGLDAIVKEEIIAAFSPFLHDYEITRFTAISCRIVRDAMDSTSTMDAKDRMISVAASLTTPLVDFLTGEAFSDVVSAGQALTSIPAFRARIAARGYELLDELRRAYLSGGRGLAPASRFLNRTRPVYEFVRLTLGIKMHGAENYNDFENGVGVDDVTTGQNVSLIHEVSIHFFSVSGPILTQVSRLFGMVNYSLSSLTYFKVRRLCVFIGLSLFQPLVLRTISNLLRLYSLYITAVYIFLLSHIS